MRLFKTRKFKRFAKHENIDDKALAEAIERLEKGLIDADLGGGLYKQRVARSGEGRSGGYRTLICFRIQSRAFFVYGFSKSKMANIPENQEKELKQLAAFLLNVSEKNLQHMLDDGFLEEFF